MRRTGSKVKKGMHTETYSLRDHLKVLCDIAALDEITIGRISPVEKVLADTYWQYIYFNEPENQIPW